MYFCGIFVNRYCYYHVAIRHEREGGGEGRREGERKKKKQPTDED